MTKDEVLKAIINLFKNVNAVEPFLSDKEISRIKLTDLQWFEMELGLEPEFKKEILFKMLKKCIKNVNNGIDPNIVPGDYTLFNYPNTIDEIAETISMYS